MFSLSRQVVNFRLHPNLTKCTKSIRHYICTKAHLSLSTYPVRASFHLCSSRNDIEPFLSVQNRQLETVRHLTLSIPKYILEKDYVFPEVREEELEEHFVRGSGPGGQSVNQTANCVILKHLPTGIVVKCHETRSLDKNRKKARQRLRDRLDFHLNGENSFFMLQQKEESSKRAEKKRRSKLRLEMKKSFKEKMGMD